MIAAAAATATLPNAICGSTSSERSQQPWLALGISPRTYYRRKAANVAADAIGEPQQYIAHVVSWLQHIGPFGRLDYRQSVRRIGIAARYTS